MATDKPNLAELRKQAGLTQADFSKQLGITQAQVSKYESSGEIPPRLLKAWANAIGCTIDEILPPSDLDKEETIFDFDDSLYGSLMENLNLLLQYTDRFPHLEKSQDVLASPTVKQFRDRVTALKEKPWVVLTGHFDSGKSHLCNFYLGKKHLPTGYRPTTRFPTFIRHIEDRPEWFKEDLWLMDSDFDPEKWEDKQYCTKNRRMAGSWDTLEQHATLKGRTDNSENRAVLAFVNAPLLHSCVLVDLPGYDDTMTNADIIDRLGKRADILMYLCPAQGFLDGGDFARLGHLLRTLPRYEKGDENFPVLGNLFIIASHAHPGINRDQLNDEILKGGSDAFYEHFKGNLLPKLSRSGQSISREDVAARFFSFYQETPITRKKLEQALCPLLETQMPSVKAKNVSQEILEFKAQGSAAYAKAIVKYEKILEDKEAAKRLYDRKLKEESKRKRRHDEEVKRIERAIVAFRDEDLKNLRTVFEKETTIENLEATIKRRYTNKKDAQKYAVTYVLEEIIQAKTADFRGQLVDNTSALVDKFLKDYTEKVGRFSDESVGETSTPFDATGAFVGGLAGLGTLGALGAWAATLGNLGGYIIVAKGVSVLSALGISLGGTASVITLVSALGGPIILAVGVAVAVGAFFSRLFGDSWQRRLAKKIKDLFKEKKVLPSIEAEVKSFWKETLNAFKKGADSLNKQHENHIKELKDAFGGRQEDLQILKERLKRYEEIKSFFVTIPWR